MIELKGKAEKYAEEKMTEVIREAFAKVYADGYRDGYNDREEEIPVNIRDNKTIYVDLGLPSGTLWSTTFEKEGEEYIFSPYEKAVMLDIPTIEQWNELNLNCRWDFVTDDTGKLFCVDCVGPNGNVLHFSITGLIVATRKEKNRGSFFWVKQEREGNDRMAAHLFRLKVSLPGNVYYTDKKELKETFSGYKLPIRLVRKK